MKTIYFDYAATTPTDPEVLRAMEPFFFEKFGNPSSPHSYGRETQKTLDESRETLASFIGAQPQEIVFTSGGTESNNHAIFGAVKRLRERGNHLIVSAIEHHSVLEPVAYLQRQGYEVSFVSTDEKGIIHPDQVKELIRPTTVLIAVMHANNEIGTIQPIQQVSAIARECKIPFLVDAVQTVGHIPVEVNELGADFLSLSAHKFYGPKGVGALYIRKGTVIDPYLFGGDQERNRRASTHNVAGIAGLAKAVQLCKENMHREITLQKKLRDRLVVEVPKIIRGVKVNGDLENRLPHNVHFSFEKLQGEGLLMSLDMNHIAASMGSACTSGAMQASHVLKAIGLSDELAYGALRITFGRWSKEEDVDYFLRLLPQLVAGLRI
jgi:cysteine desulfurase